MEIQVDVGDLHLPATVDLPNGPVRGGVAVLHGAEAGQRSFFCYRHLAQLLPTAGIAVLRYDRRPHVDNQDVPLDRQAGDAAAAINALRGHVGDVPIGLWGFSQGAWAASLTAARHPEQVAFLILVSSCGVSPAKQMRFGTAQQLHRHGGWRDMDFEPAPVFAQVSCPVLLFYGASDAWIPIEQSIAAWRQATTSTAAKLMVHRLAGCDHLPTLNGGESLADISPQYSATLLSWLDTQLTVR